MTTLPSTDSNGIAAQSNLSGPLNRAGGRKLPSAAQEEPPRQAIHGGNDDSVLADERRYGGSSRLERWSLQGDDDESCSPSSPATSLTFASASSTFPPEINFHGPVRKAASVSPRANTLSLCCPPAASETPIQPPIAPARLRRSHVASAHLIAQYRRRPKGAASDGFLDRKQYDPPSSIPHLQRRHAAIVKALPDWSLPWFDICTTERVSGLYRRVELRRIAALLARAITGRLPPAERHVIVEPQLAR